MVLTILDALKVTSTAKRIIEDENITFFPQPIKVKVKHRQTKIVDYGQLSAKVLEVKLPGQLSVRVKLQASGYREARNCFKESSKQRTLPQEKLHGTASMTVSCNKPHNSLDGSSAR